VSILACSIGDCTRPIYVKKRGLCQAHYNRWIYAGDTQLPETVPNCRRCGEPNPPRRAKGPVPEYCSKSCQQKTHYEAYKVSGSYQAQLAARRRGPVAVSCKQCGTSFEARSSSRSFCSQRCNNRYMDTNNPIRCSESGCDRGVRAKGLCAMHWRRVARADGREANPAWTEGRKANYHKRRAQKRNTQVEDIRPIDIYERDIWLCGLCLTPVDPDAQYPDPQSASLDHIQPLSLGGTHTYENVQLAHLACNLSKGNRVAA